MNQELATLVAEMLSHTSEKRLASVILECHNGVLRDPISSDNLHLFRRYRNTVSSDPKRLIRDAKNF